MDASATATRTASAQAPSRLLCAYSPTWLSGPTPGYQGLCPSWDASDAERSADERQHSLV
jgi:hypothetical protein